MRRLLSIIVTLLLSASVNASVWLSQQSVKGGENSGTRTQFVLMEGSFPEGKPHAVSEDARYFLRDMEDRVSERNLTGTAIPFAPPAKGNYHLFAEERYVREGVLHIVLTKTRAYNAHGDIEKSLLQEVRGKTVGSYYGKAPLPEIPFEIVMHKPIKRHHINCCLYSGDIARFEVYFRGELQKHTSLNVVTQKGWGNSIKPDEAGMIAFEIPRNSYADIHTDKRHKEWMLVEAEHTEERAGVYGGVPYTKVRYRMAIPLSFHTSPLEYTSEVSGFLAFIGVMLAFSLGAYYHRRRKRKTARELWFDENA